MKIGLKYKPRFEKMIISFWIRVVRLGLRNLSMKDNDIYRVLKRELYNGQS